ncbi:MAG: phosphoribosylanthranilate isomerase [Nitrospinota bacterium]|nr:phosphoribosylanthranilate isomerase [Nitrospinota bacterium]
MTKIKICGITNLADAEAAIEFGADALGFIFYSKSPRCIDTIKAKEIIASLPPFITTVGVFVNHDKTFIDKIVKECGLGVVQLHGNETADFCSSIEKKVIKGVRIKSAADLTHLAGYKVDAILIDSCRREDYTLPTSPFDWDLAIKVKSLGRIILAGGLNEDNVAEAIKRVAPYAVDVCSGIEKEPGKKNIDKMKKFIQEVRNIG